MDGRRVNVVLAHLAVDISYERIARLGSEHVVVLVVL